MAEMHSNGKASRAEARSSRLLNPNQELTASSATQGALLNRDLLRVLRAHRMLVGGIAVATAALGLVFGLRRRPTYKATAVIQVTNLASSLGSGTEDGLTQNTVGRSTDPLASLVQVLKGRNVIGLAVDSAGLRLAPASAPYSALQLDDVQVPLNASRDSIQLRFSNAGVSAQMGQQTSTGRYDTPIVIGGVEFRIKARPPLERATLLVQPRNHVIDHILSDLQAVVRPQTDIVDVSYTANDPELAAFTVNSVVQAFQLADLKTARQDATRRRIFLEQQLVANDSVMAKAQLALAAFRARHTASGTGDQFAARQTELVNLAMQQSQLQAERNMLDSAIAAVPASGPDRLAALQTLIAMPGLTSSPSVATLYTQLSNYQTAVDSATQGVWGSAPTHPDVERLRALLASTESQILDAARAQVRVMDARLSSLQELKSQSTATVQGLPRTEAEESRLEEQVGTLQKVGDQLREEHQRAQIAEAVEAGHVEILSPAYVKALRGLGLPQTVLFALLLGAIMGSGVALVKDHFSSLVHRHADLRSVLDVPVLGVIPRMSQINRNILFWNRRSNRNLLPRSNGSARSELAPRLAQPLRTAEWAESYRMLSTMLLGTPQAPLSSVLVTSATPREGKSTVVSNLAIALGRQRFRVLLIDCDLNRPSLHHLFGVGRSPGLCQVLQRQTSFEDSVRETTFNGVSVLPAGLVPSDDRTVMSSARIREILEELDGRYDVVLLDAPPLLLVADSAILASAAGGVLLVVRAGQTSREALEQAAHQLALLDVSVLGVVLNDPDAQLPRYGEPYYYGYYNDEAVASP